MYSYTEVAKRQQQRGGNPPSRPQTSVRGVYEVIKPISERLQDKESHFLHVHLPGFLREQINVSTESIKVLRVRGERFVAGNKWNRFQEDFEIPEDCNLGEIRAKFEGGTLIITMPKKITAQLDSKNQTRTTQVTPPPQKVQEDIQPKSQKADQEAKTSENSLKNTMERERKIREDSKELIKDGNVVEKGMEKRDGNVGSNREKASGEKGINETKVPENPLENAMERERKSREESKESIVEKGMEKRDGSVEERSSGEKGKETKATDNSLQNNTERERKIREESKESKKAKNVVKENVEKGMDKRDGNVASNQEKAKDHSTSGEKGKERTEMTSGGYNKVEGLLANGLNIEERKLMVNMGVAVVVIVALGAYITYNFGSL